MTGASASLAGSGAGRQFLRVGVFQQQPIQADQVLSLRGMRQQFPGLRPQVDGSEAALLVNWLAHKGQIKRSQARPPGVDPGPHLRVGTAPGLAEQSASTFALRKADTASGLSVSFLASPSGSLMSLIEKAAVAFSVGKTVSRASLSERGKVKARTPDKKPQTTPSANRNR